MDLRRVPQSKGAEPQVNPPARGGAGTVRFVYGGNVDAGGEDVKAASARAGLQEVFRLAAVEQ